MLRWDRYGFLKKNVETHYYTELPFLNSTGSTGHIDALFFMLEWTRCGFYKKRGGTRYDELVFLHPLGFVGHVVPEHPGCKMSMHYCSCSGGLHAVCRKSAAGHVTLNL
jgi:hypothetical protein